MRIAARVHVERVFVGFFPLLWVLVVPWSVHGQPEVDFVLWRKPLSKYGCTVALYSS